MIKSNGYKNFTLIDCETKEAVAVLKELETPIAWAVEKSHRIYTWVATPNGRAKIYEGKEQQIFVHFAGRFGKFHMVIFSVEKETLKDLGNFLRNHPDLKISVEDMKQAR